MPSDAANSQDLVLIDRIEKDTVIMKDGGLRQVVMVGGINFSLKSEAEQNTLTRGYQDFLNTLNFQIQVIIHSRKINIDRYLETLESRKNLEEAPLLQSQIAEYEEFVRSFVRENAIMTKTFFVVVPFAPISIPGKKQLFSFLPFGKKNADTAKDEDAQKLTENIAQLRQRTTQILEGLSIMGLSGVILEDQALVELFYNFYNPGTVEKQGIHLEK